MRIKAIFIVSLLAISACPASTPISTGTCDCPPGDEGPQGDVGPEGPQGEVGPEGPQGAPGDSFWTPNGDGISYVGDNIEIQADRANWAVFIQNTDQAGKGVYVRAAEGDEPAFVVEDHTAGSRLLHVAGNGQVGVGTSLPTPGIKLDVTGDIRTEGLFYFQDDCYITRKTTACGGGELQISNLGGGGARLCAFCL